MNAERARLERRRELERISKRAMSSQWYDQLEFLLRDRLSRGPSLLGGKTLSAALLARLARLGDAAGGWFAYSAEALEKYGDGLVVVGIDEWRDHDRRWLARVPPGRRPRNR